MASSLRAGIKHNDEEIGNLIGYHLEFMNKHGHSTSAKDFAAQTQFFLNDDLHLKMLEDQQTGLAYYLSAVQSHLLQQINKACPALNAGIKIQTEAGCLSKSIPWLVGEGLDMGMGFQPHTHILSPSFGLVFYSLPQNLSSIGYS